MEAKLSYSVILRTAVAEDTLHSQDRRIRAGNCNTCGNPLANETVVFYCRNPSCEISLHALCYSASHGCFLTRINNEWIYDCGNHGTVQSHTVGLDFNYLSFIKFVNKLDKIVCPVLESLSQGPISAECLQEAITLLTTNDALDGMQNIGIRCDETIRLLKLWSRRLQRDMDEYVDFVNYIDDLGDATEQRNGSVSYCTV